MNRPSRLMYSDERTELRQSQTDVGDVLYSCNLGVPVTWLFSFGGRNLWNPGDTVKDRGGQVGKRNPYETPVEVAMTRLEHVEAALSDSPYIWPWLSTIPILRRRLSMKKKTGYIRVVAPWVIGLKELQIERWAAATAFSENAVNLLSASRRVEGIRSLREVAPFCPFVPDGHLGDKEEFNRIKEAAKESFEYRVALLTLGTPSESEAFMAGIERDVIPAFQKYDKLPEIEPVPGTKEKERLPGGRATDSFFGRVGKIFDRLGR
ncbi:MAG: hypothetical protein JJU11_02290 [Candidatus Sumerlaeia bacterium]|nr:hypothetical protein [Candidatus Sumerlaeia bacterium]